MIALAAGILVAVALAFLLMFAQAVRLPTPRPPEPPVIDALEKMASRAARGKA